MAKFIFTCLSSQYITLYLLSDLVTRGSGSSISKSFNYMLFKCRFTNNMFYSNSLSKIMKYINASHAPCTTLCCTAAFARTIVSEKETPHFLTVDNLNTILFNICTDWTFIFYYYVFTLYFLVRINILLLILLL